MGSSNFYIFYSSIAPCTASGNRFLAFLRGFDDLGVEGTAVLLNPSDDFYRITESYQHIKVKYLWRKWMLANRIIGRLFRPIMWKFFLSKLNRGDVVFCYGSPEQVADLVKKEGVRVYHERTEHPEVLKLSTAYQQERYLQACRNLDGLFVISNALKEYFVSVGVPSERVQIVNMIVYSNRFKGLQKSRESGRYIAYCGTADNNKDGVDELIKAFAIVSKNHQDVKLYIIGNTPSASDKAGNLKLIEEYGIKDKVVFTGVVSAEQMPQILVNATILALDRPDSLQARNGFPTKLGEYLLSANPVVVTKVGDIPIFLKDGQSALLSEQRNAQEFASKLCWLLDHPKEAAIIGKNGRDVAMREFDYITETKKIISAIYG